MNNAKIAEVIKGSCADRAGIKEQDVLLSINEKTIHDIIDYLYLSATDQLKLSILRDKRLINFEVRKEEEEILGLRFESEIFDSLRVCQNRCPFCFVDQVPRTLRKTLKLKDDDYRLSFLHGNFISLTNLKHEDWQKIKTYHLSPLYISVHSTNGDLRAKIFGNPEAGNIMDIFKNLFEWGITLHTQIVLCRGINDGLELERTIRDLSLFYPSVASIAIVPVGVTRYLPQNSKINPLEKGDMREIISKTLKWRKYFYDYYGDPLLYLSDEFYVKTHSEIPSAKYYGEFPQIENGVGIMRKFITEFNRGRKKIPAYVSHNKTISVITGVASSPIIVNVVKDFMRVDGLKARVHTVENKFWGPLVDVTGLLTGQDIIETLKKEGAGDIILIPSVCLKDEHLFLDDLTVHEIAERFNSKVFPVRSSFKDLKEKIFTKYEE